MGESGSCSVHSMSQTTLRSTLRSGSAAVRVSSGEAAAFLLAALWELNGVGSPGAFVLFLGGVSVAVGARLLQPLRLQGCKKLMKNLFQQLCYKQPRLL